MKKRKTFKILSVICAISFLISAVTLPLSLKAQTVNFVTIDDFTDNAGEPLADGKIKTDQWYVATGDYYKLPMTAWGASPLWGHLSARKNKETGLLTLKNNGSDINPQSIAYIFGTTARSDLPKLIVPTESVLSFSANADCNYKFVLSYGAVNSVTKKQKYGYLEIYKDENGYTTKNYAAVDNDYNSNIVPFSKTENMMPKGLQSGNVPLNAISTDVENCTEAYIYAFHVVVDAEKAFELSLSELSLGTEINPIVSVSLNESVGNIEGNNISITIPKNVSLSALAPKFTLLEGAEISPKEPQNFENGKITYNVVYKSQSYKYNVEIKHPSTDSECDIISAKLNGINAVMDGNNIKFKMPLGTNLKSCSPEFVLSENAAIDKTDPQDLTVPTIYTVTAKDGVTQKQYTVSACYETVSYLDLSSITDATGSKSNGILAINSWYCGNKDSISSPFSAAGMDGMWGHISVAKNNAGKLIIGNNGSDVSPAVLRYAFGADEHSDKPAATEIKEKYLYINAKSSTNFKIILPFSVINDSDNSEVHGIAEIITDNSGKYILNAKRFDTNSVNMYSTESENILAGSHTGIVSLSSLLSLAENSSKVRIYSIDVVVGSKKEFQMELDFNAPSAFNLEACSILDFTVNGCTGTVSENRIDIVLPYGTDLSALTPNITVSTGATISPLGSQNFNSPINYIVTAPDGVHTKSYTVYATLGKASFVNWDISADGGSENDDKITNNAWYCGNQDSIKYPFSGYGLSGLWGQIKIAKSNKKITIQNDGTDVNPAVLRYVFGTNVRSSAPTAIIRPSDFLHLEAKSDNKFKLIIAFAAIDPDTTARKYGLMEVFAGNDGKVRTKVTEVGEENTDNSKVYSNTENMFSENKQYSLDIPLSDLKNGINNCYETCVYSVDVITASEKAYNLELSFLAPDRLPQTGDNSSVPSVLLVLLISLAVTVFCGYNLYLGKMKNRNY